MPSEDIRKAKSKADSRCVATPSFGIRSSESVSIFFSNLLLCKEDYFGMIFDPVA